MGPLPLPPEGRRGIFRAQSGLQEAAQHVLQDAAVAEIFELVERIDAAEDRLFARAASGIMDAQDQLLARPKAVGHAGDVEHLVAIEPQGLARRAVLEL